MTTFVNDEGEELDYTKEIGLTKQIANFFNFKILGDFTVNISLPNNPQNRKALSYYGPQQIDTPGYIRRAFTMMKEGNVLSRGFFVIKDSDEDSITGFYISGNANWFPLLDFPVKQLDMDSDTVGMRDVVARSGATSGIIFPLIDYAFMGEKRGNNFIMALDSQAQNKVTEMFPCYYIHSLVTQITSNTGIKFSGDVFEDALFKKMVLTPEGPDLRWPDVFVAQSKTLAISTTSSFDPLAGPVSPLSFNSIIEQGVPLWSTTSYTYMVPRTATYRITLKTLWVTGAFTPDDLALYVNGVFVDIIISVFVTVGSATTGNKIYRAELNKGDQVQIMARKATTMRFLPNSTMDFQIEEKIWSTESDQADLIRNGLTTRDMPVNPSAIVGSFTPLDLIKFICFYFVCKSTYDQYSNTVTISKLTNLKKESARDWSRFYVSHKTQWQTPVTKNNFIKFEAGEEQGITGFNEQSDVGYGGGNIESVFDAKEKRDLFKIPFCPSWDEANKTNLNWFLPYVKFYELEDEDSVDYTSVTSSGGFAQFNYTAPPTFFPGDVIKVLSSSGEYQGYGMIRQGTNDTLYGVLFGSNDGGTLIRQNVSPVQSKNHILICEAGQNPVIAGGITPFDVAYIADSLTFTTAPIAWFDKPKMNLPLDVFSNESLAIDQIGNREYNNVISERYHKPLKRIFNNPELEVMLLLPESEFHSFDFEYIYLEVEGLVGYFLVQKIENYKDALTPVKVELLYAD